MAGGQRKSCRPTSDSRSTFTRTSRKRFSSCRSRAIREHYPPDGKLRVYRSRTGGNEWEALTKGLPQSDCYVNVLRDAMAVDSLDSCGMYFGTTGGQVYGSADAGDTWNAIVRDLPAVLSVEVADAAMIRVVLPPHLRTLARVGGEVQLESNGRSRSARSSTRSRRSYPMLRGTIRDHVTQKRRPFLRFFACEKISRMNRRTPRCPTRLPTAPNLSLLWERLQGDRFLCVETSKRFTTSRRGHRGRNPSVFPSVRSKTERFH